MISLLRRVRSGAEGRRKSLLLRYSRWVVALGFGLALQGCAPNAQDASEAVATDFGDPLPGLTAEEVERFAAGRLIFAHPFSAEEGVGPRYNENACNACHTDPADGGTGETNVRKATRLLADGRCDLLTAEGGENLRIQLTVPGQGSERVPTPASATHSATFTIPFLFGIGIVEGIPEARLRELADPDDADGDGVSGRLGLDAFGRVARFGRKADVATIADFVEGAFRHEMGMTTPSMPDEGQAGAVPPLDPAVAGSADPAADPELTQAQIDAVTDFLRFLAPPTRRGDPEEEGSALFTALGCEGCHVREHTAEWDDVPAIDGAVIELYSDLLLHDMGPDLEGTCTAAAGTREYRTEPLLGLRARRIFLHDGRARRVMDAILAHGGEAQAARDAFAGLDRLTQEVLLRFLDTL